MSTAQVHNLFRWRAPIRDPPPSPPPPSYEDATRPATITDQWYTFERTFSLAESLFSPQNRRTRFEFAYLLSTALPPVFPEEDARVLASLLSKFVASTEELNTHPDLHTEVWGEDHRDEDALHGVREVGSSGGTDCNVGDCQDKIGCITPHPSTIPSHKTTSSRKSPAHCPHFSRQSHSRAAPMSDTSDRGPTVPRISTTHEDFTFQHPVTGEDGSLRVSDLFRGPIVTTGQH
ncbi:hypothetical protein FA13DRAFT_1737658 [Coprinellus micaceus]|uniref:Uncharacterized protein n=1 Tax=Coprinellus micaceus TaxID=71717 RepID=A0A4Y7SWL5_COPMI|nr:hypothetical protein FA13DRAFT_1737658 [Coprinellus micaceus]